MTARSVSVGSQPAIRIICDGPSCDRSETMFLDTAMRARMALAREKPWACAHPPTWEADYCPRHKPKTAQ